VSFARGPRGGPSSPEVHARGPVPLRPSPDRGRLSWSCSTLQRKHPHRASTHMGWVLPSCPSTRQVGAPGCSRDPVPVKLQRESPASSHGLPLSFRVRRASSGRLAPATSRPRAAINGSSHEVLRPYSVSPHAAAAWWSGLPRPTACVPRFSQPLDAFIRYVPAGHVSGRIRSWG
jgi:hypothetical protein